MSIAVLSAFVAVTPITLSAHTEKCTKSATCEKGQCEKGECASSACTGEKSASFTADVDDGEKSEKCCEKACDTKTCQSNTTARIIQLTATLGSKPKTVCSGNNKVCAESEFTATESCCSEGKTCCSEKTACCSEDKTCCSEKTSCCSDGDACCSSGKLACHDHSSDSCSACPGELAASAVSEAACQCGDGCGCSTEAEQKCREQIVALHHKLQEVGTKNALLTAQVKHSEALAKAHVEFAQQMLQKEIENAHLHAELQLANMRADAKQEIAGTAFELERVKASLALVQKHNDHLQVELTQRESTHAEVIATFKSANAGLAARIADLESRLETITGRLANKPTDNQVK